MQSKSKALAKRVSLVDIVGHWKKENELAYSDTRRQTRFLEDTGDEIRRWLKQARVIQNAKIKMLDAESKIRKWYVTNS
jgi:chorismate mutase